MKKSKIDIEEEFVSFNDDLGSYTGNNLAKEYYPEQDADDL